MDRNLSAFMICLCFVLGVLLLQFICYGEEVNSIIDSTEFTGGLGDIIGYGTAFISLFTAMFTISLPFANDPSIISTIIQIMIIIPFYGALIYILAPILLDIADLVIPDWL